MNSKTPKQKNGIIDIDGPIGRPENLSASEAQNAISYENFKKLLARIQETRPEKITLNIRSNGGDIHEALLIYEELEQLKKCGTQITTCCYGYTASAATLIAQAASPGGRLIAPSAMYLIHNATTALEGNVLDARHTLQLLSQTDQKMAEIYAIHSEREPQHYADIMARNAGKGQWLSAQEALSEGLADALIPSRLATFRRKVTDTVRGLFLRNPVPSAASMAAHNTIEVTTQVPQSRSDESVAPLTAPDFDPQPSRTKPTEDPAILPQGTFGLNVGGLSRNASAYAEDAARMRLDYK